MNERKKKKKFSYIFLNLMIKIYNFDDLTLERFSFQYFQQQKINKNRTYLIHYPQLYTAKDKMFLSITIIKFEILTIMTKTR